MAKPFRSFATEPTLALEKLATEGGTSNRNLTYDRLLLLIAARDGEAKRRLISRMLSEARQSRVVPNRALRVEYDKAGAEDRANKASSRGEEFHVGRDPGAQTDSSFGLFDLGTRRFVLVDPLNDGLDSHAIEAGIPLPDIALLLVDERQGLDVEARRQILLMSLMGIRRAVLAIELAESENFLPDGYLSIKKAADDFSGRLGFESIASIPVSVHVGDNVAWRSERLAWYYGATLLGYLETVDAKPRHSKRLVFVVQPTDQRNCTFAECYGTVAEGMVRVSDEIRVTATGQRATVAAILTDDGALESAKTGAAATLQLDPAISISYGDILSQSQTPLETTDQFEATLVWLHEEAGLAGRDYSIKLATQSASASITTIKYRIDINTLGHEARTKLAFGDIAVCNIAMGKPLVFDSYENSPALGAFILVDRISQAPVAEGMIRHSLRRAQNVHKQPLSISRENREQLHGHKAKVVWFTGLSGSGKSTLANALEVALYARGMRTYLLDGDNVRHGLNKDLGFTDADRVENIRRIAEVAKLMMDSGAIVMAAFISPFAREREMARELIGRNDFLEIYVSTPLGICEQRDTKGLYKQARLGKIPNMTGINSPYEEPAFPSYVADCGGASLKSVVNDLIELICPRT